MKKRLFLAICMLSLLLFALTGQAGAADVAASGKCGVDLTWTLDYDGTLTISGTGPMYDYFGSSGSSSYYGYAPWRDSNPTRLVLENGITSIGDNAFNDCSSLRGELILPPTIESIGAYSFYKCSNLTGELHLPKSLTEIGIYAFFHCSGFTGDLIIPDSVTIIMDGAFYECTGFDGDLYIGDGVTNIRNSAFRSCYGFTGSLTLGSSLVSIGDYAFGGCYGFTGGLSFPDTLTSIGNYAFDSSSLRGSLFIHPGLSFGSYAFARTNYYNNEEPSPDWTLILPYTMTEIPRYAFIGSSFSTIFLPASITDIYHPDASCSFSPYVGTINTIYYGGTEAQWESLMLSHKRCALAQVENVYFNSYNAKTLFMEGSSTRSVPLGRDEPLTLCANYITDENAAAETADLTWTTSDPNILKISVTSEPTTRNRYQATSTAGFEAISEGTVTVTVSANGLSDSCTVTVTDLKELTIVPEEDWEDGTILLEKGSSTTVQARYRTSGSAAGEMSAIQWSVSFPEDAYPEEGVEAGDIISVVSTDYTLGTEANGVSTAVVTATIQANDYGGPVNLTVSGLNDCGDSVPVYVPDRKITILESRAAEPPSEPTVQYFNVDAGEEFKLHMLYETMGDIEEELASFTWGVSTKGFMAEPEEGAGVGCGSGFYPASPFEVTWTEEDTGKYLVSATFTPAITGLTALKVDAGDFTNDCCVIYAKFDEHIFWADQYWNEDNIAAGNIQTMILDNQTPSDIFVSELQKHPTFHASAETWTFLSDAFSTVNDVSHLYDVAIRDYDLYLAMILNILKNYSQDTSDTFFQDMTATFETASESITDTIKLVYDYDLHTPIDYKKFITDEKNHEFLDQITRDVCADQFAYVDSVGAILSGFDFGLAAITTVDEAFDKATDDLLMAQLCDSMKAVVHAMYHACVMDEVYGAEHGALRYALKECADMVDYTTEDVLEKQLTDASVIVGKNTAQEVTEYLWDCLSATVKNYSAGAAIAAVIYETGAGVVSEVLGTDATIEAYYKMLMIQEIREVAEMALDDLAYEYETTPTSANAQAYLSCIDFLFSALDKDCTAAYAFTDNVSKSILDNIQVIMGDTSTADAKESIINIRRSYQTQWTMSYIFWIDYLPEGPLAAYYEELYYPIFGFPVWRETVACPVDVYVYNGRDQLVAWVEGDKVGCTVSDLTIARDGDEKNITCYSGSPYSIRYAGTDTGEMNVIWEEFGSGGSVSRTVAYYDVPLSDDCEYTSSDTFTLDGMDADLDTATAETYTLTMAFGMTDLDADSLFTAQIPAGTIVPIRAQVAENSTFTGWTSDQGTGVFTDPTSLVTTLRMPEADVTVRAQIKRPDNLLPPGKLTVSGADGYLLSQLPDGECTVRVAVDADTDLSGLFFAAYDANGQMLKLITPEIQTQEDNSTLLTFVLDNSNGKIDVLRFFRLDMTDGLKPTGNAQSISAKV